MTLLTIIDMQHKVNKMNISKGEIVHLPPPSSHRSAALEIRCTKGPLLSCVFGGGFVTFSSRYAGCIEYRHTRL